MKTIFVKPKDIEHKWFLIDANGLTLGRLAVKIANILRGKHKTCYTPHQFVGDAVVVINADKIVVTGKKYTDKLYYHHSQYPGGLKTFTYEKMVARKPCFPLEKAVKGMLPKGPLGREMFRYLKIYAGDTHPHASQKPEVLA